METVKKYTLVEHIFRTTEFDEQKYLQKILNYYSRMVSEANELRKNTFPLTEAVAYTFQILAYLYVHAEEILPYHSIRWQRE